MNPPNPERRRFLTAAAGAGAAWLFPPSAGAARRRRLVLIELAGGNDGLNTIVPYADPHYYRLRGRLAIPRDQILPLSGTLGLHASLEKIHPLWQARELAIALGVGYPQPNRSHFRSIEIWETGSPTQLYAPEGWVTRLLRTEPSPGSALDGIVLGDAAPGPLAGTGIRTVVMRDVDHFLARARALPATAVQARGGALAHVLQVREDVQRAARELAHRADAASVPAGFPATPLGRQLRTVAHLISQGTTARVFKVSVGGFDTHSRQAGRHARLLTQLAEGLAALRSALIGQGHWTHTLVMSYSEFGRRAAANASGGTDHGTAAAHFLAGGRVRGGLYGRQPALDIPAGADVVHHLDFRRLYATAAAWWGLPGEGGFRKLDCIA